jgi:6-phosphogluconolactonase
MKIEGLGDAEGVAKSAAAIISEAARTAVAARGRFAFAVSGGHTPWQMLRALAGEDVPWPAVHVIQVDERVAPQGDPDRNLTHLNESLLGYAPLPAENVHAMPVESPDLAAAAASYVATLRAVAGTPPVLDLVHLGLGPDGHTASLVPGDPVLDVTDADVALAGPYQGRRRIDLHPLDATTGKLVKSVSGRRDGREEEAVYRAADHWVFEGSRGRHGGEGAVSQARL